MSVNQTIVELLKSVPKRVVETIVKLASVKGIVWIIATVVWLGTDRLTFWEWLSVSGLLVGARTIEKLRSGGAG